MSKVFNYIKNSKLVQKMKCFIISKSPILIILLLIICIYLIITYKAYSADGIGSIVAASIAVLGVYYTAMENKKKTYNEIVTRERIEWLHKMQEALAEFLSITSNHKVTNRFKDNKDRARELYYLIISNLNVKKEDGKENDREAVESLYNYTISKGLDVELNFDRNVDGEEKKDYNVTKSIDDSEKEIDDLKDTIKTLEDTMKTLEDKIKILQESKKVDSLDGHKRKEIIKQYTEIFNETWNRIKNEAD